VGIRLSGYQVNFFYYFSPLITCILISWSADNHTFDAFSHFKIFFKNFLLPFILFTDKLPSPGQLSTGPIQKACNPGYRSAYLFVTVCSGIFLISILCSDSIFLSLSGLRCRQQVGPPLVERALFGWFLCRYKIKLIHNN